MQGIQYVICRKESRSVVGILRSATATMVRFETREGRMLAEPRGLCEIRTGTRADLYAAAVEYGSSADGFSRPTPAGREYQLGDPATRSRVRTRRYAR